MIICLIGTVVVIVLPEPWQSYDWIGYIFILGLVIASFCRAVKGDSLCTPHSPLPPHPLGEAAVTPTTYRTAPRS